MNYLTLENIKKSFGEKILFDGLGLFINEGEKIALIARNGTGKTTLLQVISGQEGSEGETARILFKKDLRIGYLKQETDIHPELSVIDAVFQTDEPKLNAVRAYEEALYLDQDENLQKAMSKMDDLKAWDTEARVKEILTKLNIGEFNKKVGALSGGQYRRLSLAQVLVSEPEFLILDEPTNHLDLEMIEWLEEYLAQPSITMLLVTHDRYFLDRVCNKIIELENGKLNSFTGNYADYLEKKALITENQAVNFDKSKKLFAKELEWVRRMPQARTTKAKSRIDAFDVLKDELSQRRIQDDMEIRIKPQRLGSKILEVHNISKQFNGKTLFKGFDYKFKKFDKVGIIGPNGSGKSTFLNIITGSLPTDSGKVIIGDTTAFGYYSQSSFELKQDKRVIELITDIAEYIPTDKGQNMSAASMLEKFLFTREHQQVFVSQLSGGEKRRLFLLTVLMKNPNFLILDEPTNDLDLVTLNVLEDYLLHFEGCLIIVTHDRYFMDKMVDHLFVFGQNEEIIDYPGNYSQYRAYLEIKEEEHRKSKSLETKNANQGAVNYEAQKELQKIEREINKLETEKKSINEKFLNPDLSLEEIQKWSLKLKEIETHLEQKEIRWLELMENNG